MDMMERFVKESKKREMTSDRRMTAFAQTIEDVAKQLATDPVSGLSAAQVRRRLETHGPNQLRRAGRKSFFAILMHQFQSLIVWLLTGAAALSFMMGDLPEALAIIVVLLINGLIGLVTELRATRSMEALMQIAEVQTRVRRGGAEQLIPAQELVPGDVVVLDAGDVVTADLRLAEASNLQANESVLTGESVPVGKDVAPVRADAVLGDRTSMVFKGTSITQGAGVGLVVGTGMQTELGQISDLVQRSLSGAAPLERRLDQLGHRLIWLTVALAILTIGAGLLHGHNIMIMLQTGVALAVAAVPEGLPVVATLCLARGMWRMSARNALIRQLSSVETLGATTVILTDKTGTLTENRMTVVRYFLAGGDVAVQDHGARFVTQGQAVDPATDDRLGWALRLGAFCNNAKLGADSRNGPTGDPMEIALLATAQAAGMPRADLLATYPEEREYAFDPGLKMMATVHVGDGGYLFAVKGAPEAVIAACTQVAGADGPVPLDDTARRDWSDRQAQAASDGLRLLAFAMKYADAESPPFDALTLVGLVGLRDPIRAEVPDAIAASRSAGVRVVMLTGDHADTARAIAQQAGLSDGELNVVEGAAIADLDPETADDQQRAQMLDADVFARVTPETKLTLVAMFQNAGHVVAMTGDGVNDAPALKKADIGIAMGAHGTQVAQEAADMVLRDDAFSSIVAAMREGRVIFDNIRKFVVYLMSCNVSEVLVVGIAVGGGLPMPLLPLQILFLNLVTDVFPAFALGLGQGDEHVMQQPPRDPSESIIDKPRWVLIAVLGLAITMATLGAFVLALYWLMLGIGGAITVAFVTLALAQLWNVFNLRDHDAEFLRNDVTRNPYVWGAIVLCLGLIAMAVWLPPLAKMLNLDPPGAKGLLLAAGASVVPLIFGQLWIRFAPIPTRHDRT